MQLEITLGDPFLLHAAYVVTSLPKHWPHIVVGWEEPEQGTFRAHALRYVVPAELHYMRSVIASQLPRWVHLQITCQERS
jgi:hypothetical protein